MEKTAIARITLNRPDRLNSFTAHMHEELRDALANLGDARVVVLTGAGRGFCAGQDRTIARLHLARPSTLARPSNSAGTR